VTLPAWHLQRNSALPRSSLVVVLPGNRVHNHRSCCLTRPRIQLLVRLLPPLAALDRGGDRPSEDLAVPGEVPESVGDDAGANQGGQNDLRKRNQTHGEMPERNKLAALLNLQVCELGLLLLLPPLLVCGTPATKNNNYNIKSQQHSTEYAHIHQANK